MSSEGSCSRPSKLRQYPCVIFNETCGRSRCDRQTKHLNMSDSKYIKNLYACMFPCKDVNPPIRPHMCNVAHMHGSFQTQTVTHMSVCLACLPVSLCLSVCGYVCMHVCTRVRTYASVYVCAVCIHVCMHPSMYLQYKQITLQAAMYTSRKKAGDAALDGGLDNAATNTRAAK